MGDMYDGVYRVRRRSDGGWRGVSGARAGSGSCGASAASSLPSARSTPGRLAFTDITHFAFAKYAKSFARSVRPLLMGNCCDHSKKLLKSITGKN